ncbi:unnamed protein product [Gemmata massiliana]|uniref:Carboxypeptidase regulatory-like domain-containing protein n=1 Tax=Gemmata massiliana TaxID=1210884 RepID=A0A6P2CS72_9BACT|nr:carboxypeptidase regulatory-like domain-containing protein [Gemmata massiliana]VTR91457.1 unnamed protein product [Gemmata massiliana]
MATFHRVWLLATAVLVAAASGCGAPTAAVSGTVTGKDGKPVTGVVAFIPQDGAKYREAAEARIVDGRYDLPAVSVGPKRIEVIVTRDGVGDPSLEVTPQPRDVDLKPGPQVIDVALPKSR